MLAATVATLAATREVQVPLRILLYLAHFLVGSLAASHPFDSSAVILVVRLQRQRRIQSDGSKSQQYLQNRGNAVSTPYLVPFTLDASSPLPLPVRWTRAREDKARTAFGDAKLVDEAQRNGLISLPSLSDPDVERIAQRVAVLVEARPSQYDDLHCSPPATLSGTRALECTCC
ncbi:hypothetical protein EXIGLDRAFT_496698 [Exidia glandulosa HHB12029]|uniref:Uncharacterized protein n=1 Tax=Exidia glandulosa HHB12029 TaxID=1314781 RepID=A0A165JHL7_EXIGL|nr:hypothetical protein EXIGLDRAFT_496698 [Exidia glandulosa HHB12029]